MENRCETSTDRRGVRELTNCGSVRKSLLVVAKAIRRLFCLAAGHHLEIFNRLQYVWSADLFSLLLSCKRTNQTRQTYKDTVLNKTKNDTEKKTKGTNFCAFRLLKSQMGDLLVFLRLKDLRFQRRSR